MNPNAPEFVPRVTTPAPSAASSDATMTQARWDQSVKKTAEAWEARRAAAAQTLEGSHFTMRNNNYTPRHRRSINGPEASPADKWPEDSPSRTRHTARFAPVPEVVPWPNLSEASRQTGASSSHSLFDSAGTMPSGTSTSMSPPDPYHSVEKQAATEEISLEDHSEMEAQVVAFRQHLMQERTPNRAGQGQQQHVQPMAPVQEHTATQENLTTQQRPSVYPAQQQRLAQQTMGRPSVLQQARKTPVVTAEVRPPRAQEPEAATLPTFVPRDNPSYSLHGLLQSQQSQRQAAIVSLQSALDLPRPRSSQKTLVANTGSQAHLFSQAQHRPVHTGFQGYTNQAQTRVGQPNVGVFQGYSAQPQDSAVTAGFHTYNPHNSRAYTAAGYPTYSTQANVPATTDLSFHATQANVSAAAHGFSGYYSRSVPFTTGSIIEHHNRQFETSAANTATPVDQQDLQFLTSAAGTGTGFHGYNPRAQPFRSSSAFAPNTTGATVATEDATITEIFSTAKAPAAPDDATETGFQRSDLDCSPPPLRVSPTISEIWDEGVPEGRHRFHALDPDTRPLSPSQESGARYGIQLGGIGVSTLGTSDRNNWFPSPWNPSVGEDATQQNQRAFRVRPLDHQGWGGWEWSMRNGWGDEPEQ